jgi:hypothetical protein
MGQDLEASAKSHNRREDEKLMSDNSHKQMIEMVKKIVEIITNITGIPHTGVYMKSGQISCTLFGMSTELI